MDLARLSPGEASPEAIDLGVGSPDLEPPPGVIEALADAARRPGVHGYGASRGIAELREAIAARYRDQRGVSLDPEREVTLVLGSKEGFAHTIWATVDPGECVLVPNPSYPTHDGIPRIAGARTQGYVVGPEHDVLDSLLEASAEAPSPPRVVVASFPHNPTGTVVDHETLQSLVEFAHARRALLIHDFAYADFSIDGALPPSILEVEGGNRAAIELYSLSKSYSMAGWRVGFAVGDAEAIGLISKLKPYVDNGAFLPVQAAALHALTEFPDHPAEVDAIYRERAVAFCRELSAGGWPVEPPAAGMYVWAPLPEGGSGDSEALAAMLAAEAGVLAVPGSAFGEAGEGFVRFALVQPLERLHEAATRIGDALARWRAAA